jgi:DNA invertase Pin-like site-specific DNA recombinase
MTDTLGYLRVSKEEQARGDRTSLAQQREGCEAIARRLARSIGRWYEDPGFSGGSARRPGFQALFAYCRANPRPRHAPGLVLALNASRWGRFPVRNEAHWWMFELERVGWDLRFVEGDDATDATTRHVTRSLGTGISADYREAIRANALRGGKGTAGLGYWQTEAPFGYRRQAESRDGRKRVLDLGQCKAKDERVRLTPGPAPEVALVRWMFKRYATGELSLQRLAAEANRRHPGKRWGAQVVRAMLRNPAYRGDVIWGRRPQLPEGGQPLTDPGQWVVTEGAHPALVPVTLFDRVQARFSTNRKQTRLSAGGYPLSGLLTCAHCGDRLTGGGGPKGPADEPDRYRFYRHSMLDRRAFRMDPSAPQCPALMAIVPKRIAEPQVIAAVADIVTSPQMQHVLAQVASRMLEQLAGQPAKTTANLEKKRTKLLGERDRLVNLVGRGTLDETEVAARIGQIRAELADLDQLGQQARFSARRLQALERERTRLLEKASVFAQGIASASGAQIREWLRPWLYSAVVDRMQNVLLLTIQPPVIGAGVLESATRPGPDSRVERAAGLIHRSIPLPPSRSFARNLSKNRRFA